MPNWVTGALAKLRRVPSIATSTGSIASDADFVNALATPRHVSINGVQDVLTDSGRVTRSCDGRRPSNDPPGAGGHIGGHASSGGASGRESGYATRSPQYSNKQLKPSYSEINGVVQVLSVDDEEVNQMVMQEILESVGYKYVKAMDGLEALSFLESSDTLPDLILLDCMMPVMSGHEFCVELRKTIPSTVVPVIMVSAKSDEENIVEGLRKGCNDFIRKPYQRDELLARIGSQLRLRNDSSWLAEIMRSRDGAGDKESLRLLKNILPESIIQRIQSGQNFVADSHRHVCVLFTDIVGFTNMSAQMPTAEVFLMLSNMFGAFDRLTDRFDVYKVETIGDAYMAVVGHDETPAKAAKGTPVQRMLQMAKGMLDVVANFNAPNGEKLRIRVGMHCGPAYAGVVGMKCPRYCFLGDTVNTASRMESLGFPMCINVSEAVVLDLNTPENFEMVGLRDVKGKGKMKTFLLKEGDYVQELERFRADLAKEQARTRQNSARALLAGARTDSGGLVTDLDIIEPIGTRGRMPSIPAGVLRRSHTQVLNVEMFKPAPVIEINSDTLMALGEDSDGRRLSSTGGGNSTTLAGTTGRVSPVRFDPDAPKGLGLPAVACSVETVLQQLRWQQQQNITLGEQLRKFQTVAAEALSELQPLRATRSLSIRRQEASPEGFIAVLLDNLDAEGNGDGTQAGGKGEPRISNVRALLQAVDLGIYADLFEKDAVGLDLLLTMDHSALQALGVMPVGHCMRIKQAVIDLARQLLQLQAD